MQLSKAHDHLSEGFQSHQEFTDARLRAGKKSRLSDASNDCFRT
jgi:hypothetical protein